MKRLVCVGSIVWAMLAAPSMGELITVQNAGFEDYVLPPGDATENGEGLAPWAFDPAVDVGVWNISDRVDFPDGAPEGVNVAYSYGSKISQLLSVGLAKGGVYVLRTSVGASPFFSFPGYRVQLWAGGTLLVEDNNSLSIGSGTHEVSEVVYPSPFGDPNAGAILEIRLLALGPEVTFDDATLMRTDCEPPSLVAYWPAEGNTQDVAGVYDGTLEGNAAYSSGKVGRAFSFDGNQAQVTLATFSGAALPPGEPVVSIGGHDSGVDFVSSSVLTLATTRARERTSPWIRTLLTKEK